MADDNLDGMVRHAILKLWMINLSSKRLPTIQNIVLQVGSKHRGTETPRMNV